MTFISRYSRILGATYVAVLLLSLFLVLLQAKSSAEQEMDMTARNLRQVAQRLNAMARDGVIVVSVLRAEAEADEASAEATALYDRIAFSPDRRRGDLDALDGVFEGRPVGNLTGYDIPPGAEPEILRALSLTAGMRAATARMPDVSRISYASASGFVYSYPFAPADHGRAAQVATERESFWHGQPQHNPDRSIFWTAAYVGDVRKELMVTCGAPVYHRDSFVGTVSMNLAVDDLNEVLRQVSLPYGRAFLMNDRGQLLADPQLVSVNDSRAHHWHDALPRELWPSSRLVQALQSDTRMAIEGYDVMTFALADAPWTLVFVGGQSELVATIAGKRWFDILGMATALSWVVFIAYWTVRREFIAPAERLLRHIESEGRDSITAEGWMPSPWRHWFSVISRIFEEVRVRESRLRSIMDSAGDAIITIDRHGTILDFNKAAERVFDFSADYAVGRNVSMLMPEPHRWNHNGYIRNYLEKGEPKVIGSSREVAGQRKNGEIFPMRLAVSEVKTDAGILFTGICTDITDAKRREKALVESEALARTLLDAPPVALILADSEGRILSANQAAYPILRQARDIIGEVLWNVVPEEGGANLRRYCAEALLGRSPRVEAEETWDGRWFDISVVAVAGDARTQRLVVALHEITQHKRVEEEIRNARDAAAMSNKAKSEFLANMSHELRTPLNAIIGFSEVMQGQLLGPLGTDRYIDYAGSIAESGRHLLAMINDILDVSKIEAGKMRISEEPFDMTQVVESCLRLTRGRADAEGVTVDALLPPDLPMVRGDELRIKQVLLNLLSNAVKFTPQGGVVTVRACVEESGALRLVVADTGIGIAAEDFETVMTPFGQVDSRLSRLYGGSGLGLPLAKSFMEMHGGTLDLESEVGVGTAITITLPAERLLTPSVVF